MSNQPDLPGEMPTTPATETGAATAEPNTRSATLSVEERIERAVAEATKKANAEAVKFRKQLEAFEKAEQAKADAELSEIDKLRKGLETAQAELKATQLTNLKQRIAAAAGLPVEMTDRLKGDTEDALKADAEALAKLLRPAAPKLAPTNPGEAKTEDVYATGKRLIEEGLKGDIWQGGGVRWPETK